MKAFGHWSKTNHNGYIYIYIYVHVYMKTNDMVPHNLNTMLLRRIAHLDVSAGQLIFRSECSCCAHYQACGERKPCQGMKDYRFNSKICWDYIGIKENKMETTI